MSTLSIRLPDSLHRELKDAAQREGVSINQLIVMAVTRQVTQSRLADLIAQRGGPVGREEFLQLLNDAGNAPPAAGDEL